ncbi:MAG: hypothetical protein KF870_03815 [Leadbetterella sp.]|nr:hypothetical protein [Leadbetterella sp.]
MKKQFAILALFIIASLQAVSQKHAIRLEFSDVYDQERIWTEIQRTGLTGIDPTSDNEVRISYDLSRVHQLEGMTNSFSGNAKVLIRLKNRSGKPDTTWSFSSHVKVKNKWDAYEKLTSDFLEDSKGLKNSLMVINHTLDIFYSRNCTSVLAEANEYFRRKNLKEAYANAKKIEDGICGKEAKNLIAQVENTYSDEFCGEILPRIKILASSGVAYQMEKAIELLYRYPPKAKCNDEVQKVAKSVGDYISKLPQKQSIEINNILSNGQSFNKIFEY